MNVILIQTSAVPMQNARIQIVLIPVDVYVVSQGMVKTAQVKTIIMIKNITKRKENFTPIYVSNLTDNVHILVRLHNQQSSC